MISIISKPTGTSKTLTGDDVLQCRNIYPLEVIECKYDYEKNQLKIITKPVGNIDSVFYKIV